MLAEGRAGAAALGDGTVKELRLSRTGALVQTQGHASFAETVLRGGVMEACTPVAGFTHGTAFALAANPFVLWNPPSSGKNLIVMKATIGYISGTLGAGCVCFGIVPSQNIVLTAGTEITPQNALLGFPRGVGRAWYNGTVLTVPTILRPSFSYGPFLATTAVAPFNEMDIVDGGIVVTQGTALVMQGIGTAGTTPLLLMAMTWEEVNA